MSHELLSFLAGLAAGALATGLVMAAFINRERRAAVTLRAQLAEAGSAQAKLAERCGLPTSCSPMPSRGCAAPAR